MRRREQNGFPARMAAAGDGWRRPGRRRVGGGRRVGVGRLAARCCRPAGRCYLPGGRGGIGTAEAVGVVSRSRIFPIPARLTPSAMSSAIRRVRRRSLRLNRRGPPSVRAGWSSPCRSYRVDRLRCYACVRSIDCSCVAIAPGSCSHPGLAPPSKRSHSRRRCGATWVTVTEKVVTLLASVLGFLGTGGP
jgi:hypothetical protein